MKWILFTTALLFAQNSFGQLDIKTMEQAKELIQGKWDIYEYCVYEARYSKKDSSSSIIFYCIANENKIGYAIWEKGKIVKEGISHVYDDIKVRTSDKYTLDNFLFQSDDALIISFLDEGKLSLLQDSNQGFAKHYQKDTTYVVNSTPPMSVIHVDNNRE